MGAPSLSKRGLAIQESVLPFCMSYLDWDTSSTNWLWMYQRVNLVLVVAAGFGFGSSVVLKNIDVDLAAPILTIGTEDINEPLPPLSMGLTKCDDQQVDFQLSVHDGVLELIFCTSNPYFEPCQRLQLPDQVERAGLAIFLCSRILLFDLDSTKVAAEL
jgi:hypothetical protein